MSSAKSAGKTRTAATKSASSRKAGAKTKAGKPVALLSRGTPQIAKGDGDAPVQAYIAAMPGWIP